MDTFTVRLNGKDYIYDGQKWFGADDYMQPSVVIIQQLKERLPRDAELLVRMHAKRSGLIEMRHFLGYHSPEVMGCTADECDGLGFLTSKEFGNPVGDVLWFVGKASRVKRYFLRSYYVIVAIRDSDVSDFNYRFVGTTQRAGLFEPMLELTDLPWFKTFFPTTTCAQGFGMDTMAPSIVNEFKKLAATAGCPFAY